MAGELNLCKKPSSTAQMQKELHQDVLSLYSLIKTQFPTLSFPFKAELIGFLL